MSHCYIQGKAWIPGRGYFEHARVAGAAVRRQKLERTYVPSEPAVTACSGTTFCMLPDPIWRAAGTGTWAPGLH